VAKPVQPAHAAHPERSVSKDVRAVQELLGHKDVTATVYTRLINRSGRGMVSPANRPACAGTADRL
jgi:integrase